MNIKVDFDNIVVKEDNNDFNVKILMLKGEKGDAGAGENNIIEEVQVNGTALPVTNKAVNVLVPVVDSALSSSSINTVQNKVINSALNNKVDNSVLNNYYEISEVDNLLSNKVSSSDLDNYYTKAQTYNQTETNTMLNSKADISALSTKANTNDVASTYATKTELSDNVASLNTRINSVESGSPLVASSTSEMTDTTRVYVNTSDDYWYYYDGTQWVQGGIYQSSQLGAETVDELYEIIEGYYVPTIHGNLFNANTCTDGKYLTGSDGHEATGSAYSYSDYIPTYGKDLLFSGYTLSNAVYCYDINKNVLGKDSATNYNANGLINGTSYIRFNFGVSAKSNVRVHFNAQDQDYDLNYGAKKIRQEDIMGLGSNSAINVYVGSTRQITDLITAVETYRNQATKNTPVNIYLDAGTYNTLTTDMLENGDSNFEGLTLPDYMNIYGSGRDQTFVTATVPVDISSYSVQRNKISTINAYKNNNIKDVTISMTNGRYAFHNDDFKSRAVANAVENFENVHFIYETISSGVSTSGLSMVPVGIGAYNGRITTFKNCIFENKYIYGNRSLLLHNSVASPVPCRWEFELCDFIGGTKDVGISSAGSGQVDEVLMKGCKLDKNIEFYPQSVYTQAGGTESEFIVRGYANIIPGYTWTNLTEDNTKIRMI